MRHRFSPTQFIYFLTIFLSSCQEEVPSSMLILDIELEESKELSYSSLFKKIEYTLLDAGDKEFLAMPGKVKILDSLIFMEDRQKSFVFIFRIDGSLKSIIKSALNPGPGEFLQLEDFQVWDQKIHIRDRPMNKMISFDLEGNFLFEKKEESMYYQFFKSNDWTLTYLGIKGQPEDFLFSRKESNGDTSFMYRYPNEYDWLSLASRNGFMLDESDSKVYYNLPYSYHVIRFDSSGVFDKEITFNMSPGYISDEKRFRYAQERVLYDREKDEGLVINIETFFPLDDYFFVQLRQGNPYGKVKNHTVIYDKEYKQVFQGRDLMNDLDGMFLQGIPWSFSGNGILLLINSNLFYNNYLETFSGKKVNSEQDLHHFFQEKKERLKEDQLVLVSILLKDDLDSKTN